MGQVVFEYGITFIVGLIFGKLVLTLADSFSETNHFSLKGFFHFKKGFLPIFIPLVHSGLWTWVVAVFGISVESILYCLFTSALLTLSIVDLRIYEIPILVNGFILALGVVRIATDFSHWYNYVIGFFAVSVFLYIIVLVTKGRGMGGGDVKLMAVAGVVVGWKLVWVGFLVGCILGSIIHVIRMKIEKDKNPMLAFGPYLSLGLFLAVLYGNELVRWYLHICGMSGY